MHYKVSEIFDHWHDGGLISSRKGPDLTISSISSVETCGPGDLVFVDKGSFVATILSSRPACIVTSEKLARELSATQDLAVLVTPNVGLAQALMRQKYQDRDFLRDHWPVVHPTAVIHETATLGEGSTVGPTAVVGAGACVGQDCILMAGCVIEHGARIGDRTIIHPNVTVGYDCELGVEVVVHSGSVIGSEGYGFAQDEKGKSHRIPQLGKVVLEDRVRIGACNCIDRAAYAETRIGAGTKLDNLCHIAHNVQIGQDCLLTAGLIIAGSTKLGDRVVASGSTGILDHLDICDDAVFVHRAGVTKDISKPGVYAGIPVQPLPDYLKNQAATRKISEMRQKLRLLETRIDELEKKG